MGIESSPNHKDSEEEKIKEVADSVLIDIENAWEDHIEDSEGLLLSAGFAYQEIQKQLEAHARAYGEALFRMARSTTGKERLRYADGLSRFLAIITKNTAEKVLADMLTNRETVKELQRMAREELENSRVKPKGFFSRWWKKD